MREQQRCCKIHSLAQLISAECLLDTGNKIHIETHICFKQAPTLFS